MYNTIYKLANLKTTDKVLDCYCGIGTIGIYLSKYVDFVYGIEEVEDSISLANKNKDLNRVSNIQFFCGRVKNILKFNTFNVDVVIIDPPRSGLVPKALKRIADLGCSTIIYVSCNPTTLLRDLNVFNELGYVVDIIQPVDMFPQTYHIENVVRLKK